MAKKNKKIQKTMQPIKKKNRSKPNMIKIDMFLDQVHIDFLYTINPYNRSEAIRACVNAVMQARIDSEKALIELEERTDNMKVGGSNE